METTTALKNNSSIERLTNPAWKKLLEEYSLKAIKTFRGRDGEGFNANLCRNGKNVAEILDEGNGGGVFIRWTEIGRKEKEDFENMINSLPKEYSENLEDNFKVNEDIAIEFILHVQEMKNKIKRAKSPKIIAEVHIHQFEDMIIEYKEKFNESIANAIRSKLEMKFPGKPIIIWNEYFSQ